MRCREPVLVWGRPAGATGRPMSPVPFEEDSTQTLARTRGAGGSSTGNTGVVRVVTFARRDAERALRRSLSGSPRHTYVERVGCPNVAESGAPTPNCGDDAAHHWMAAAGGSRRSTSPPFHMKPNRIPPGEIPMPGDPFRRCGGVTSRCVLQAGWPAGSICPPGTRSPSGRWRLNSVPGWLRATHTVRAPTQ